MKMKTVGILGGMGPLATVDLFNKIILETDAHTESENINVVISSNTDIPDRTQYITKGGENPLEYIIEEAKKLQKIGADGIVMPCNTAHYFFDKIQQNIDIPLINMIEETAKVIVKTNEIVIVKLDYLQQGGRMKEKVYNKTFKKYNLDVLEIPLELKLIVQDLIQE